MNVITTTLQVPVRKSVREQATKAATEQGLSSLQEAVRIFLHQLATHQVEMTFSEPAVRLSAKNERRYAAMVRGAGDTAPSFSTSAALLKHLNG